jgi:class 3 adenylate cyclase
MFTDIAGFTALMQRDEREALRIRERHRAVLHQTHGRYGGRLVGKADALREELEVPTPPRNQPYAGKAWEALREKMGEEAFREAFEAGKSLEIEAVVKMAAP